MRIPRDWYGPREELVPFGPRAGTTEAADAARSDLTDAGDAHVVDVSALARTAPAAIGSVPPRPDDFWGEGAAAIHDAVQIPELNQETAVLPAVQRDAELRSIRKLDRSLSRPAAWRAAWTWCRNRLSSPAVEASRLSREVLTRRRPRSRSLIIGAAAAGLTVIAIVGLTEPPAARVSREPNRNQGPARATAIASDRQFPGSAIAHLAALSKENSGDGDVTKPARTGGRAGARSAAREKPARRVAHHAVSGGATGGSADSANQSPSVEPVSYQSASQSDAQRSGASASAANEGTSAGAGPVGPGSPFGPGRLG